MTEPLTQRPIKRRNRTMTMERILSATNDLFAQQGVEATSLSEVAERAGINKVLIYRYFGNRNGLIEAFVQRGLFLSIMQDRTLMTSASPGSASSLSEDWQAVLVRIGQELSQRPAARALLRWEMDNEQTEPARRIGQLRNEALSRHLIPLMSHVTPDEAAAITALLWSGLVYLALSSEYRPIVIDVPIQQEAGWQRIERAVDCLSRSLERQVTGYITG